MVHATCFECPCQQQARSAKFLNVQTRKTDNYQIRSWQLTCTSKPATVSTEPALPVSRSTFTDTEDWPHHKRTSLHNQHALMYSTEDSNHHSSTRHTLVCSKLVFYTFLTLAQMQINNGQVAITDAGFVPRIHSQRTTRYSIMCFLLNHKFAGRNKTKSQEIKLSIKAT